MNAYRFAQIAFALPLVFAGPIGAEEEDLTDLDLAALMDTDVIVTSQKRAQNPHDVPVSLTVFSAADLKSLGATSVQSLPDLTPGLRLNSSGTPSITTLTLRGVGQRNVADHNEGATILFVDGTYVNSQAAVAQPFYDLERVEVVKGPQGTLFGRNATGGLIHVISKRPTRERSTYFTLGYGSFDDFRFEGAVNRPLTDTLTARFSLSSELYDGYIDNIAGGSDIQAHSHYSGRLQLLYEPNEDFNFLLNARATLWPDEHGSANRSEPLIVDANGVQRRPTSYAEYSAWCTGLGFPAPPPGSEIHGNCVTALPPDEFKTASGPIPNFTNYYAISGTAEWRLNPDLTLTSVSDYQYLERRFYNDIDGMAQELLSYKAEVPKGWQASQEVRLNGAAERFNWIAGLYALYIDNHSQTNFDDRNGPPFFASFLTDYTQISKSQAAFAQIEYKFHPEVTAILGARFTHDAKTLDNFSTCAPGALIPFICAALAAQFPPGTLAFSSFRGSIEKDDWSGRAVLDWHPTEDVMLYAGVNRGTKSGGFNSGVFEGFTAAQVPYDAEVLTAYESGFKVNAPGAKTSVNGAVFYYDYEDFQTYEFLGTGQFSFNVDASVKGAELELVTQPLHGWGFTAAVTYLDTVQKDVPTGSGPRDFPIPDAPPWSLRSTAQYGWNLFNGRMSAMATAIYLDRRTASAITFHETEAPAYARFDARLTYTSAENRWSASAFVNNITDESIEVVVVPSAALLGANLYLYDKPRWFGAAVTVHF